MHTSSRPRLIRFALVPLVLLAVLVMPAAAQEEEAKPAMKFGPIELWPTMAIRNVGIDNNVYNDAENPKKDFTATIAPTMLVLYRGGDRIKLSYTTLTEFVWFAREKEERSANRGFVVGAEANLRFFTPFATYSSTQTRERPNAEIDERARRNPRTWATGLRTRLGLFAQLSASLRRSSEAFDPEAEFRGVKLATQLDRHTDGIDTALTLSLTPLTSVGVAVTREEDRFDLSPLRNSKMLRITPTVSFAPTGLLSGSASVGYLKFDAADARVGDYGGLYARGSVAMSLERYHVETTFGRDVRYSYEVTTPTYITTHGRGTLRTELFGGLDVKLSAGRDNMHYQRRSDIEATEEDVPSRDIYDSYSFGLGWTFRKIRFGVDGEFGQRKSAQAARSYQNNRIFGTISWGATPR